jgi:hypothetical protein
LGLVTRRGALLGALVCLAFAGLTSGAQASAGHRAASGQTGFRPRIGNALGIVPPVQNWGKKGDEPSEGSIFDAVTYRGGQTMTGGVTVHTIFWAPSGYAFQGSPDGVAPTYEGMIEQFFSDVSAGSTGTSGAAGPCTVQAPSNCNAFTVEPQYAWGTTKGGITPGDYQVNYNNTQTTFPAGYTSGDGAIVDTDPYPAGGCTSPEDTRACLTDQQIQNEVDKIVQATAGTPRGLHNLWYVYTPPNVDECISPNVCETTAFGGYHSLSNVGHGVTIYAYTGDPLVETDSIYSFPHPEGNPAAETSVDISLHETNESMSDPEGTGYIDSNAYEIGDKCEFGRPVQPLGYATNGQPYDQVINGHKYWTQSLWSQADGGCVGGTNNTSNPLPLPQVNLTQYSSTVTGNTENGTAGIGVTVNLIRANAAGAPVTVASGSGTTNSSGAWSVNLSGGHAIGDDRDEVDVVYSGTGAPKPHHQVILTGNGGNAWIEGGWTGFTDLNQGAVLTNDDQAPWSTPQTHGGPSLTMSPCFQTGVLGYRVGGTAGSESPTDFCSTSFDTADTPLASTVSRGQAVLTSSLDNRAFQPPDAQFPNASGGLVKLTVKAGEPDSTLTELGSPFPLANPLGITPSGPPTCTADLGAQRVSCIGLIPGAHYTLTVDQASGVGVSQVTADAGGTVSRAVPVQRRATVTLSNGSRTLTTLHVANLRVDINGDSATVASGTCTPDEYWGAPLTTPPINAYAGEGSGTAFGAGGGALTGEICPKVGIAYGLPTSAIAQTDEHSGGQTVTEVADVASASPLDGETMYGSFTALAVASAGRPAISLKITPAAGGKSVFFNKNVDTANGVTVKGLKAGNYTALWTVTDANGDTRRVTTRFIEQPGSTGSSGAPTATPDVSCKLVQGKHKRIACHVAFAKKANAHGELWMKIAHGSSLAALGHSWLHHGATTVTMRQLRSLGKRSWWMTFVVHIGSDRSPQTLRTRLLVL